MSLYEELRDAVGKRLYGIQMNIDTLNACSLRCHSCALGSIGTRGGEVMSLDLFKRIMDKAQSETKIRRVQLYVYSDICLRKDAHLFVQELTDRGIESTISTMLQRPKCDYEKLIEARPTEFRISFPGFNKMNYFQTTAKPEEFKKWWPVVTSLPRYPETKWNLVMHVYKDNQDEIQMAREMAEAAGMHLVLLPAIFMPLEKTVENRYSEADRDIISHMIESPEEIIPKLKPTNYCGLWWQISLDARGDVFLCQLVFEERFRLMNYMDAPIEEIRQALRKNSFCTKCLASKANQIQSCYADMVKYDDPISVADKKRRYSKKNEALVGCAP
jgi:sulfatase maturation enzyme AslB (radical SAM superfamily)